MKFNVAWSVIGALVGLSSGVVFYEVLNSYVPLTEYNKLKYTIYDICRDKKQPRNILVPGFDYNTKCECIAIYASEFADKQGIASAITEDLVKDKGSIRAAYVINTAKETCEYRKMMLGR